MIDYLLFMATKNVRKNYWNIFNPRKFYEKIDVKRNLVINFMLLVLLVLSEIVFKKFYDSPYTYSEILITYLIILPILIFISFVFFNTFYKAYGSKTKFLEALSSFILISFLFFFLGNLIRLFVYNFINTVNSILSFIILLIIVITYIIFIIFTGMSFKHIYKIDYYKIYSIIILFGFLILNLILTSLVLSNSFY